MADKVELTIVQENTKVYAVRCVYLNNKRIKGGKPYISEGLKQKSFDISKSGIIESLIYLDNELKNSITSLSKYQKWRIGESDEPVEPKELTESINTILKFLQHGR